MIPHKKILATPENRVPSFGMRNLPPVAAQKTDCSTGKFNPPEPPSSVLVDKFTSSPRRPTGSVHTSPIKKMDEVRHDSLMHDDTPTKDYGKPELKRAQAQHNKQIQSILDKQPTTPQKSLSAYTQPFEPLRGVTWLPEGAHDHVVDIFVSVFGEPNKQELWMRSIPSIVLCRRSEYFEKVLEQQGNAARAKVVLSVRSEDIDVQVAALSKVMRFILKAPLDLNGPRASKDLFWVQGVPKEVMEEMRRWTLFLGLSAGCGRSA